MKRESSSISTPVARIVSEFWRWRMICVGVCDSVTLAMAPSRLLKNAVARTDARANCVSTPPSTPRQRFRIEQRVGVGDLVADREAAMQLVEARRAIGVVRRRLQLEPSGAHDIAPRGLT